MTSSQPSYSQAWWTVFVLFVASTLSYIDRWILALLVGPLKAEFDLNDSQIGLLNGAAFAIFYATMALPIAWLSDRKSRRAIISAGITIWCLATAACGFAQNFWQLFTARMGVGVGESTLSPAAFSLIADLFPKEKRGFAYGAFGMSVNVGGALALIIGASVIAWVGQTGEMETFLGTLKGWQLVFLFVGVPGLLVALLALTMTEPRRRTTEIIPVASHSELVAFMKHHARLFLLLFTAFPLAAIVLLGFMAWGPTFYVRVFHLTPAEAGWALGLCMLVAAPPGAVFGGWLLQYWTKKGHLDAPIRLTLVGIIGQTPFNFLTVQMPTWELAIALQAVSYFFSALPYMGGAASYQLFTPPTLRARISSLHLLAVTVLAMVVGPYVVGFLTDYVFGREGAIGQSLYTTVLIFAPLNIILLFMLLKPYRRAVQQFEQNPT